MSYKRTIELVNPLTDERKFVDVEIERNCSQLIDAEAERHSPDGDWCLVGVHPHGHIDPMDLRVRIDQLEAHAKELEAHLLTLDERVGALKRRVVGPHRSL